jgi:hypothetical protein
VIDENQHSGSSYLQVRSASGGDGGWICRERAEAISEEVEMLDSFLSITEVLSKVDGSTRTTREFRYGSTGTFELLPDLPFTRDVTSMPVLLDCAWRPEADQHPSHTRLTSRPLYVARCPRSLFCTVDNILDLPY